MLLIVYLTFYNTQALAYIDPGTGGIILQAILGFIAAVGATITLYWRKFKELLKKFLNQKIKLTNIIYESRSFRDPAGRVFYHENEVYREVAPNGQKRLEFLQSKNLLNQLIDKEYLIKTEIIRDEQIAKIFKTKNMVLKHEKINFISYPYEWTFSQLKDAAIFHLNFQIFLLEQGAKLIDASAYNIQFKNNKPIFIDLLSIDEYNEGEYWFGHKQFCENFLNPLILKAKKGIDFNNWFKGNLEGISTLELNNILNWKDFLSFTIFFSGFFTK